MLRGEILKPYRYNGVQFEIGNKDSFFILKKGESRWIHVDNISVYKDLLTMDRQALVYGVPVSFLLDCFKDFETTFQQGKYVQ